MTSTMITMSTTVPIPIYMTISFPGAAVELGVGVIFQLCWASGSHLPVREPSNLSPQKPDTSNLSCRTCGRLNPRQARAERVSEHLTATWPAFRQWTKSSSAPSRSSPAPP